MPIEDYSAAAQKIAEFLRTLTTLGGLRLKYRITAGPGAADPWHILPVFVIVSMFLSQFLTPSPGMDQSQQRMMAFMMPVVFGFMMWNLGSGVDLYWVGSNIMGVGTQNVMNRTSMGREMREIAARRAAKKRAAARK